MGTSLDKKIHLKGMLLCVSLALAANASAVEKRKLDFVVGVDGDFKAALNAAKSAQANSSSHFVIFFPDGEYNIGNLTGNENQLTNFTASHVSLVGQSVDKTVVYNKSINEGISITATLYFNGVSDVYLQDITLLNKANYGDEGNCGSACRHVTVQQVGDMFVYKNVKLLSTQDTYYTKKSGASRTYWEGGQIEGTVDFICGDGNVFFEGTNLVMRRNGGYITASQNNTDWGYVFNNTTITVTNNSFNNTFYLGRSWARAKTVFLNTKMVAQPKAEGWGPDMNSAPAVFGEYNSKDGNGNAVNTSQRKTRFDGGKDASTAEDGVERKRRRQVYARQRAQRLGPDQAYRPGERSKDCAGRRRNHVEQRRQRPRLGHIRERQVQGERDFAKLPARGNRHRLQDYRARG